MDGVDLHPLRVLLQSVIELSSASGAHLVRWVGGVPQVVVTEGRELPRLRRRPDEGVVRLDGLPAVVVSVTDETDLVVVRDHEAFNETAVRSVATAAKLVAVAAEAPRRAWVALHDVTTKIVSSLAFDEVLLAVANSAAALMRADIAGILLLDETGQELQMRCSVGHRAVATSRLRVRRSQGLAGLVLTTGRAQRVEDYPHAAKLSRHFLSIAEEEGSRSAMAVPVLLHGAIVGVLCVWRRQVLPFLDEDEDLLRAVAEMAALAVHNARSYEKQRTAVASLDNERAGLAERYGKAEQALLGHAALTRLAIEGGDVDAVATAARRLIGARAVLLTGPNCRVEEGDRNDLVRLSRRATTWTEAAEPVAGKGVELLTAEPDGTCVLEVPVRVGNAVFGQLHLALDSDPGDGAITVAEQAAAVCALLWSREDAATSWVRQLWSELVWDVLDGQMSDGAEFLIRQRHLGLQLEFPARVAIVEVSGLGALAQQDGWDPERLERARAHIERWIGRQLGQIGVARAPQVHRGDIFAVLLPCSATRSLDDVRELGSTLVSHQPRGLWRAAGFSGPAAGPVELAAAFGQARTALASTWRPEHPVGLFEELGVLEFLVSPTGGGSLARFARQTLGPLLDYDSAHGTCLVPTLAAYLAEDCTAHRAAKRLYVHPKTMQYRMQRIQELTGLQLCNQEDLFQMQLALKILNLGRPKIPAHQPVGTKASK